MRCGADGWLFLGCWVAGLRRRSEPGPDRINDMT
jgi:hypothetical protein